MKFLTGVSASLLVLVLFAACSKAPSPVVEVKKLAGDADVPRISIEDAKKEVDSGNAVIVDSRPDTPYNQEHITGAVNIPFGSSNDIFSTLPKGKKIIVYCS